MSSRKTPRQSGGHPRATTSSLARRRLSNKPAATKKRTWNEEEIHPAVHSLFRLLNIDPSKAEDRQSYDNGAVLRTVLRNPDAVKRVYDFKGAGFVYPLSMAVCLGASIDVIDLMYNAFPEALEARDNCGLTPLKYACWFRSPLEIVRFLVERYPAALAETGSSGWTALHYACYNDAPVDVVKLLVRWYPEALDKETSNGNTPLMLCVTNDASPELLTLLTTIHSIRNLSPGNDQLREMLLETKGSWNNCVGLIVDSRPSVVQVMHLDDKLIPSVLFKVGRHCSLQTMHNVVKEMPDMFKSSRPIGMSHR